ncbi:MAG: HAMP domain-containing histidine kinase, partial [Clostridia bacterium]|nr:HAMP domain-containing histidine kinase [Clostridia bacterium]
DKDFLKNGGSLENIFNTSNIVEIKEELINIAKELKADRINLSKMLFAIEDDKYIPVEMTVGTNRMEDYKTVKISDYVPLLTVNVSDDYLVYHSYNLRQKGYTANMYKLTEYQLEDKINDMINSPIQLSGKSSYLGIGNRGYNSSTLCDSLKIGDKTYTYIFIGPAYNEYYETFTNEYFVASMVLQGILFAIAYLIALRVATKIYKKSEQLTRSQRAFTSAAAHELKTPLAVIQNQCECIIENVAPEKNEDYIKSVYDEAVRMNGIVSSFLQYNRLVNADKLQKEKCSLREIVLTEIEKYKAFADMRGVTINAEISADEITVNCNRDLISMAVDNYLSNAIKYATGEKKVTVKLEKDRFSVYNTSEGISRETADSMWDILSRDNKARTKDGSSTGMGLPICAEIFKAHGYEYGYRNVKDGVEFYFAAK